MVDWRQFTNPSKIDHDHVKAEYHPFLHPQLYSMQQARGMKIFEVNAISVHAN